MSFSCHNNLQDIISLVNSTKDNDVHWVPIMGHTLGWVLYVPHLIDSLWQLYDIQAFFLLPLYKWENIETWNIWATF